MKFRILIGRELQVVSYKGVFCKGDLRFTVGNKFIMFRIEACNQQGRNRVVFSNVLRLFLFLANDAFDDDDVCCPSTDPKVKVYSQQHINNLPDAYHENYQRYH